MAILKLNKQNIIPSPRIIRESLYISISSLLVKFIINFFGIGFLLKFVPDGFKLMAYVIVGVYLRGLLDIRIKGRDIL